MTAQVKLSSGRHVAAMPPCCGSGMPSGCTGVASCVAWARAELQVRPRLCLYEVRVLVIIEVRAKSIGSRAVGRRRCDKSHGRAQRWLTTPASRERVAQAMRARPHRGTHRVPAPTSTRHHVRDSHDVAARARAGSVHIGHVQPAHMQAVGDRGRARPVEARLYSRRARAHSHRTARPRSYTHDAHSCTA